MPINHLYRVNTHDRKFAGGRGKFSNTPSLANTTGFVSSKDFDRSFFSTSSFFKNQRQINIMQLILFCLLCTSILCLKFVHADTEKSKYPTFTATTKPTNNPSFKSTGNPTTSKPTNGPTTKSTRIPTTSEPTNSPTFKSTQTPTTLKPTYSPTFKKTQNPSTSKPTLSPSLRVFFSPYMLKSKFQQF
jgi:hypothetical protein